MQNRRVTPEDVKKARQAFEAHQPRHLFYRAATDLVDLALRGATSLTVAEALAVLLQTWNRVYYRYRTFDQAHVTRIEQMVSTYRAAIAGYRTRAIDTLNGEERATIVRLFQTFEDVLGPVGASKALHLLAPGLFPLWGGAIAKAYALPLGQVGSNGDRY